MFLKVYLSKIPVQILFMIFTYPISIEAVVIGEALSAIIYFIMSAFLTGRLYAFGPLKQIKTITKYIISSGIMLLFLKLIKILNISSLLTLLIGIFGGIFVYSVMLIILKDNEFKLIVNKFFKHNKRTLRYE